MRQGKNKRGIFSTWDGLGIAETSLPQVPQVLPENLGQRKPNRDGLPRVPQVAPSENKVKESENGHSRRRFLEGNYLAASGKTPQIVRPKSHHVFALGQVLCVVVRRRNFVAFAVC